MVVHYLVVIFKFVFVSSSAWFHSKDACWFLLVAVGPSVSSVLVYQQRRAHAEEKGQLRAVVVLLCLGSLSNNEGPQCQGNRHLKIHIFAVVTILRLLHPLRINMQRYRNTL